ncbi:hypothetical protein CDL12_06388 [Handroanthus impetiginosus]|uniref:DUF3741 domain-containing protein n=1 Tax=Handroanthus impetiginosus TaxID=429701 RepID=A0A2G9HTR5_9LAMI|nr:hypothetical protein CDL12_06388 [Handroanthus impetiginosus]
MLKRQESSLSSSRRQSAAAAATTPPPATNHTKSIGCMSGIIQLFSKYQNPKKRIAFGKKQEQRKPSSPAKAKGTGATKNSDQYPAVEDKAEKLTCETKRLICDNKVPRSPTLPPEIRQSNAASSPENQRTPSSLVARLMGLEDIDAAARRQAFVEYSITEKRRRLLQALEKCNEDLEALKKIIKAVQTADMRLQPPRSGSGNAGPLVVKSCGKKCTEAVAEETNIPAVTAEELSRSPPSSFSVAQNTTAGATCVAQQRRTTAIKKPGEDDEPITKMFDKSTITQSSLLMRRRATVAAVAPPWSSRAMIESVEEACNDIAWGEKREIGRIGLALQDYLCRELIEEVVKELKSCPVHHSLPLEACKRSLRF